MIQHTLRDDACVFVTSNMKLSIFCLSWVEQVTFAPTEPPPPAYRHNLELGGRSYTLYTYSFLNFGQVGFLIYNICFGICNKCLQYCNVTQSLLLEPFKRGLLSMELVSYLLFLEDSSSSCLLALVLSIFMEQHHISIQSCWCCAGGSMGQLTGVDYGGRRCCK
jgi:hypothetical protein